VADINEVFSYQGPTVYADEAPSHSDVIGMVLQGGLAIAQSAITAKYGTKATIPGGGTSSTTSTTTEKSAGIGLFVVLAILLLLFMRR